jgi:biotin carboxylase
MVECTLVEIVPKKVLLIIGAGKEQIPAYKLARSRGITVVGTDVNPDAPAFEFANYRLIASTRNIKETLNVVRDFASKISINGVMTIANDVPMIVSLLAEELKLKGISTSSARLVSNKIIMKNTFVNNGVATPKFSYVEDLIHLKELIKLGDSKRFVIKPVDGRGARGVLLINKASNIEWAYQESLKWSELKEIIIEEFVEGLQLSTESFLIEGRAYTPAIAERNYEYLQKFSPYIIENGGNIPALLSDEMKLRINSLIELASKSLGVTEGIVKGDLIVSEQGDPLIIELALRLSGGWFSTHQIPAATGVNLVDIGISYALGEKVSVDQLIPKWNRATSIRYWFPPSGNIKKIEGIENLAKLPGLVDYGFFRDVGEFQPEIKMHPDRFGYLIVEADDREASIDRVEDGISRLKILID